MRCIYMGKHKRSVVDGLDHLLAAGWEVVAVVAPPADGRAAEEQRLDLAAERVGLTLTTDDALYAAIEDPAASDLDLGAIDLVLSFLFWKRIRKPLIDLGRSGCLNFHPAPLPDMRGIGGYNVAILEDWPEWGVSAHFVDDRFDTGDLVRVDRFPLDRERETALSLDVRSQRRLLEVFRWTVDRVAAGEPLPRTAQGEGRYVTREQFELLRAVQPGDDPELTARRIRAFWYPPYDGATLEVGGRTLSLVDRALLDELAALHKRGDALP